MIKYWKDVDILDIELKEWEYEYSEEIAEGIILDIDKKGEIISIEILDISKRLDNFMVETIKKQLKEGHGSLRAFVNTLSAILAFSLYTLPLPLKAFSGSSKYCFLHFTMSEGLIPFSRDTCAGVFPLSTSLITPILKSRVYFLLFISHPLFSFFLVS